MYLRKAAARAAMLRNELRQLPQRLGARLPRVAFLCSLTVLGFAIGFLFGSHKWFPYASVQDATKTAAGLIAQYFPPFAPFQFIDFAGGDPSDVERRRFVALGEPPRSAADEHFLASGGIDQYLDYCPGQGCIAVEFARSGALVNAYPYRPGEFDAHRIVSLPYEQPGFRFSVNMYPFGLVKLPGGDLIVTFHQWKDFPGGGGIARVRPDGSVAWFRHDYGHHWPWLLPDGTIAVPAMRIGGSQIPLPIGHGLDLRLQCDSKTEEDIVRILDPDGRTLDETSVFDALLDSPYRAMLIDAPAPCDPLHLNYITPVTSGIMSLYPDVAADDLVVSLRNLNAFAILGRQDHRLKHLFTGTFLHQHAVQPLGDSATMLVFDDLGASWQGGPSRLIAYNLADRAERTVLPNGSGESKIFSGFAGDISVSPDLSRALVASAQDARAYEVRLSDGKVLTMFNNIHDLRKVPAAGAGQDRAAARFELFSAKYVH